MNRDLFRRAAELFERARTLSAHERAALLEEACAGDPALRAEVESLLEFHGRAAGFLEE